MTVSIEMQVGGLRDLEAALGELKSEATRRNVGIRALKKGGAPMVATIKRLAPKDEHDLERAVAMNDGQRRKGSDPDVVEVLIGLDPSVSPARAVQRERTGSRSDPVTVLGPFQYGPMQEEGTIDMPANPFFRPGFDQEVEPTISRVGAALGPEIEAAAGRQARKAAQAK